MNIEKWDQRFLDIAHTCAQWSKEPRKKVGAVIVDADRAIVSMGYNGFPRGVHDTNARLQNRELKNKIAVHAEINAILQARRSVRNCTLYVTPLYPCSNCAGAIINAGIIKVVAICGQDSQNWTESMELAQIMFKEAGVQFIGVSGNE